MYIWMFGVNDNVYYGRTWEELKTFLNYINDNIPYTKYLFIHNIPTIICAICLICAIICRKRFLNSLKGSQDIPCKIENIKKKTQLRVFFFIEIFFFV